MNIRLVDREIGCGEYGVTSDPSLVDGTRDSAFIPYLHRALANAEGATEVPVMPRRPWLDESFRDVIAYWEGAYYALLYLLGWSNPAQGLLWFYQNGKQPLGEPVLEAIKAIWDNEGQLSLLAAWLWKNERGVDPGPQWWHEFERQFPQDRMTYPNPFYGGGNPLHLRHIKAADSNVPFCGRLLAGTSKERTAVLLLERATGWYFQLGQQGARLPVLQGRSWHVDVVVKPIGWLGMFRQSRSTGRWFRGKHSVHIEGN